jgi:cell division protein FtsB
LVLIKFLNRLKMHISNEVRFFTKNNGHRVVQQRIVQQVLLVVVQYLRFKLLAGLELLVVFVQKVKKISAERQANIQRHNWYLRTEAVSLPLREKKP